jgi:hypothetical protein
MQLRSVFGLASNGIQKNKRAVHIWGRENPHVTFEQERDSPKVNVFCGNSKERAYGSFC